MALIQWQPLCRDRVDASRTHVTFSLQTSGRCPAGLPLARLNDSDRLELTNDGRFMIEWFVRQPGDDIVAFKFMRR
ncbi:MAG: hypothetical protein ACREMA_08355 [Longimicrobiales bacterium]